MYSNVKVLHGLNKRERSVFCRHTPKVPGVGKNFARLNMHKTSHKLDASLYWGIHFQLRTKRSIHQQLTSLKHQNSHGRGKAQEKAESCWQAVVKCKSWNNAPLAWQRNWSCIVSCWHNHWSWYATYTVLP